jgi:hypothetical protein
MVSLTVGPSVGTAHPGIPGSESGVSSGCRPRLAERVVERRHHAEAGGQAEWRKALGSPGVALEEGTVRYETPIAQFPYNGGIRIRARRFAATMA